MENILAIMPNIALKENIKTEFIDIINSKDIANYKIPNYECSVLSNFIDEKLNHIDVTVLIQKKEINQKRLLDAVINFRNIISIYWILKGRKLHFINENNNRFYPFWSNYFDLSVVTIPSNDNGTYSIFTPAYSNQFSKVSLSSYKFQKDLQISDLHHLRNIDIDAPLLILLLDFWKRQHIENRDQFLINKIFRSFYIIFEAVRCPMNQFTTHYDWGVKIGLWISAIEILLHPEKGDINKWTTITYIDDIDFSLHKKFKISKQEGNIVQKLLYELYKLRNDYAHGNHVDNDKKYILTNIGKIEVLYFAPLIYSIILEKYLKQNFKYKSEQSYCGYEKIFQEYFGVNIKRMQ